MKKRIGRKQLIANLKEAKRNEQTAKADLYIKDKELERMKDRLRELGKNTETIDGGPGITCIKREITPIPYGDYSYVAREFNYEYFKNELVRQIAAGLLEENMVQIIHKTPGQLDGPLDMPVMAVKLYVVPWEQMAIPKRIYINRG